MCKLAKEITTLIIDEETTESFLRRISDPYWFQAFGCVLGYDWHSSGVTTVVTGVLKKALSPQEHGLAVCGGKGRISRKAPDEISKTAEAFGFSEAYKRTLTYTSRMTAKVDNTAIQAGYQLYHHAFILAENKKWAVIQQGMSPEDRTARRYHWLSDATNDFVVEPHKAIVGDVKREKALDMTAKQSEGSRKASVDIVKEPTDKLIRLFEAARPLHQTSLKQWMPGTRSTQHLPRLIMPRDINWDIMKRAY
jgi:hypothetical protein